jgi:SAM-dependent methyltransferase
MTEVLYEGRDLEVLADMRNYYDWIMETFAPHVGGNVLEYGSGIGTISTRLLPFAERLTLVEHSVNLVAALNNRFADSPQVEVIGASLEEHVETVGANTFNTVVMVNVLEHVEDDGNVLVQLFNILKPGGRLLVFVPALQGLMSKLDLIHGHFRRYDRKDLMKKIAGAGGEVHLCRYFDVIGVVPWLILNKLLRSTGFNPALIQINDRLVVPMSRVLERVVSPPFGKNLIMVAEKPELAR